MAPTIMVGAFFICYNLLNKEAIMYTPYPYSPYSNPTPNYGYPNYNSIPSPQTSSSVSTPVTNTNKIFVNGLEDARNRNLPPNSDYVFLDNDKPLLYQKVVDAKGQFEMKIFDIVPHVDTAPQPIIDTTQYALRTDIQALSAEIDKLKEQLTKIGGHNESIKQPTSNGSDTKQHN